MATPRHHLRRTLIVYLLWQGLTVGEIAAYTGKSQKVIRWYIGQIQRWKA